MSICIVGALPVICIAMDGEFVMAMLEITESTKTDVLVQFTKVDREFQNLGNGLRTYRASPR